MADTANGRNELVPACAGSHSPLREPALIEIPPSLSLSAAHRFVALVKENACFILLAVIFRAVRKRPWVALLSALLLVAVALLIVWYLTPASKYTARALVQFDLVPSNLAESPQQQYYLANLTTLQKTHAALIRSRAVLQAALENPELRSLELLRSRSDPITYLEQNLNADFGISPEIMRVTLSGQDAVALQKILQAVVSAYLAEAARREHGQTHAELERTKSLIAKCEEKIQAKRARLREIEQAAGAGQTHALEVFLRGYLDQLDRTRRELANQRHALHQVRAELQSLLAKHSLARQVVSSDPTMPWFLRLAAPVLLAELIPEAQVEWKLYQDPQLLEKRRQLQKLEAELQAAQALLAPNLPRDRRETLLKPKQDAILEARIELDELTRRLRPLVRHQLTQEFLVTSEQRLAELRDKYNQLAQLEAHFQQEVLSLEKLVASLKRNHLDLQWLREEIDADGQMLKRLTDRKDQLEMLCNSSNRVRLFEGATILPTYEGKKRWFYIILAISAALMIWLASLLAWEWHTQSIYGPEELAGKVQAPIITSLPRVQHPLDLITCEIRQSQPHPLDLTRYLESVDALRALLLHLLQNQPAQVILVTSAVQGEGKTSLSCHLAASLARSGRRTLLVDADLRRARAHKLLGASLTPGLAEVLQGQLSWHDALKSEIARNLDFLPAGLYSPANGNLLGQTYFQRLLEQWRQSYDLVILDSSPVLLVADALGSVQGVDAVLLAVMHKVSTLPRTQIACQRLMALGAHILGFVVNGVSQRQYDHYYGSYYGYHSTRPKLCDRDTPITAT